jgi:hypothetical protein
MPNPADAGLPNPAQYMPSPSELGNGSEWVLDRLTGLLWSKTVDGRLFGFEGAAAHCAAMGEGYRLPTAIELISLVDYTRPSPTIDPALGSPLDYFWSSSLLAGDPARAWLVYFGDGHSSDGTITAKDRVRCVTKKSNAALHQHYDALPDGEVTDHFTRLTWQPLSFEKRDFAGAAAYCIELGYRAPSMKELQTLVDRRRVRPSIDEEAFPETPFEPFWTSSAVYDDPDLGWTVSFELGRSEAESVDVEHYVRCVR